MHFKISNEKWLKLVIVFISVDIWQGEMDRL